ncbi:MAG: hypothetical protein JNK02_15900 [Planctomycetes bacterium]|nr:hypothetical protein [Planctomycetota bacterium]
MTPAFAFAASFLVTLVLLGVVAWSGARGKRRVHVPAVVLAYAALGVTIWCAYALGETLDLGSAGAITPIHLTIARVATLALVLASAFGARTLFRAETRRTHGRLAWTALAIVVLAAITGLVMVALAEPR